MNKKARLTLLRAVLGILIILNMIAIYRFSGQDGVKSAQTSEKVAHSVAEVTVPKFEEKPKEEQKVIVEKMNFPVRKIAHMTEFASLGMLIFLLLLTWKKALVLKYICSLTFAFLYACTDETHQIFTTQRSPAFTDVLIDTSGALISCTLVLLAVLLIRGKRKRDARIAVSVYPVSNPKIDRPLRIAVAADLHGTPGEPIVELLRAQKPDLILIPGDLTDDRGLRLWMPSTAKFLQDCAAIAPTYYSLGNHELGCYHKGNPFRKPRKVAPPDDLAERVAKTGAVLLENSMIARDGLTICGLTSGLDGEKNAPDGDTLNKFAEAEGFKILLCHHPEYYAKYIRPLPIDLTVCGHAHGGHWRVFGRGIYAPGQGLFPKYTSGAVDSGRCVISRGLGNHTKIPRFFNPREIVVVEIN